MSGNSSETSTIKRLEGKVALITGGASGIGATTATIFVKHGAKVLIADIQDDLGHTLCKQLGPEEIVSYVHCDVTSDSDVGNAVDLAVSKYGKLDIMYNNAGISGSLNPGILSTENEEFKRVVEVNVFGGFLGAKHAARVMIPAKKGCILFTSSAAAVTSLEFAHPYCTSKHAVVGLAKNLSVELGKYGIRVNCVSPFGIVTPMLTNFMGLRSDDEEMLKKYEEAISYCSNLKEAVLEKEDIANAVVYLASDEAKYVSGINLVIDGGFSITNSSFSIAMQSLNASLLK